ncbi:MAG: hypothetical protein IT162_17185 [Bryobacterales bacterium]|nr:hypothetical protein [Bryobacterales bacterium]
MKAPFILFTLLASAALAQTTPDCPTTPLVAGEAATGALAATDCRLRDMITGNTNASFARRYQLDVETQGVFPVTIGSAEFPASVSIYAGTVLRAQASALQSATGRVTINLPPGSYTLYVFSPRADATGAFELKADRQDARECPVGSLDAAGTAEASFSESGCRFVDLNPFSTSTAYVNFYRIEMPRRAVLSLTAESAIGNFSTVLSTAAGTSFRALKQMTVSLLPGSNLVSFSSALAGSYTIKTAVQDLRECPLAEAKLGEEPAGELTRTGCRWLDVFVPSDDPSPSTLFRFVTDTRAIGRVEQRSSAFDAYLILLNARTGAYIGANDDASSSTLDSLLLAHLPPGEYVAMATSADGEGVGAFTMRFGAEEPRKCDAVRLTAGETANGAFPEPDTGCRLIDYMNFTTLLTPVAPLVFEPAEATMFGLKLEGALSSTLRVVAANGQEAIRGATDRNGDVNTEFRVPAGPSTLLLTTTATPRPAFQVTAQSRAIPECPAETLSFGVDVESVLTTVECKVSELGNYLPLPTPAKSFRVKLAEAGTLRVRAESAEFGPFLALLDGTATALGSGAVPGNSGALTISGPLPAGDYTVAISSLGITVGTFKLQATFTPAITAPVITGESIANTGGTAEAVAAGKAWPRMTRDDAYCGPVTRMEAKVRAPVFNWCAMLPLESTSIVRRPR